MEKLQTAPLQLSNAKKYTCLSTESQVFKYSQSNEIFLTGCSFKQIIGFIWFLLKANNFDVPTYGKASKV